MSARSDAGLRSVEMCCTRGSATFLLGGGRNGPATGLRRTGCTQDPALRQRHGFVTKPLDQWAFWNKIALDRSRPGKPTDNAFIESFNGGVRRELLNPSYFETIEHARRAARVWRTEYNEFRPHSMLANKTPKEFAAALQNQSRSRFSNDSAGLLTGGGSKPTRASRTECFVNGEHYIPQDRFPGRGV